MRSKREELQLRCIAVGSILGAIVSVAVLEPDSNTPFLVVYLIWWVLISGAAYFIASALIKDE